MREFVLSEAPLDRVAAIARTTVEDLGGVVAQHTPRITEFDHLREEEGDWSRSGYVGTFARYEEDPVRLRVRVWASWPRKLFLWSIWLGLVEAVIFFSMSFVGVSPPPNVWILTAIGTFALIAVALLMYATSWADSADLEDEISRKLTARLVDDEAIPGDIYTIGEWEEHRADVIEGAVEQAEREAPERPSRAKRMVQSVTSSGEGPSRTSQLVQRFKPGDEPPPEDEAADDAPEDDPVTGDEPATETPAEAQDEEGDADEDEGLVSRLAFWRGGEDDEPGEATDEEAEDLEAKRKRLKELKRQREQAAASETPDEDQADGDEGSGGVLDKVAFWRGSGEEPSDEGSSEDAVDEDGGEDATADAGSEADTGEADAADTPDDEKGA